MKEPPRISIVGAGNVGATSAAVMVSRRLGEVSLFDVVDGLAAGKAMDINHASVFFHSDRRVTGCDSFRGLAGSDVVVVTAGAPRRAGMKRKDLLQENYTVLAEVGEHIMRFCPDAIVLVVTNPVEMLTWLMKARWPEMRVFGLGCTLDTLRFRFYLAEAACVAAGSVSGVVIGSHDDEMVPLVRHASIGGARADRVLEAQQVRDVVTRTREAGAAVVSLLKTRGSYYAAAYCVAEVVEAIVRDTRAIFPLSVVCGGQYGYEDLCLALPITVGQAGAASLVEIALDDEESVALDHCAAAMRSAMKACQTLA